MNRIDCLVGILTIFALASLAQEVPQPLCVVDLSSLAPQGGSGGTVSVFTDRKVSSPLPQGSTAGANGTVTFLSDHVLAVGMCFKSTCNLQTIDVADAKLRLLGSAQGIDRYHAILPYADGVLLSGARRGKENGALLLGRDLQTSRWIPAIPGISALGEKIPEGRGRLLAYSSGLAAYQDQNTVRIQGPHGEVAAFGIDTPRGWSSPTVVFLGGDRILFEGGSGPQVRDLKGNVLQTLNKPDADLGEKTRYSEDGTRVLYDSFTRRVGAVQATKEKALAVATMGMSTDGDVPNGEMIRVIDTRTGKSCFEWYGNEKLLPPFADHADIDPTGRLVAIMTQGNLSIFRLPDSCTAK